MNWAGTSLVESLPTKSPTDPLSVAVSQLTLSQFRNYESLRLNLDPSNIVLTGPNGAGKTNLLEAISLLAPGRGFRGTRLADFAHKKRNNTDLAASGWGIATKLISPHGQIEIGTGLEDQGTEGDLPSSDRRVVRINGNYVRGPAVLTEVVAVRWLTPAMDRMFTESASRRRKFLDHLTAGIEPTHASRVSAYERTMRQRSKLLKEQSLDLRWISALEETLVQVGTAIAAQRLDYVARLGALINLKNPTPIADCRVSGDVEGWLQDEPALEAEVRFRETLEKSRSRDAILGGSVCGPHRSDLEVIHINGMPAGQCSTGEQKTILLELFQADARLVSAAGSPPLLLLDEISAHLDDKNRSEVFETILDMGAQVWATGTDAEFFNEFKDRAQFLKVVNGSVLTGSRS